MTPDAADGNTQQGQAAPVPQGMSRPRRSPVKRVREEEEEQGNGAMDAREGVRSEEDFATTRATWRSTWVWTPSSISSKAKR